MTRVRAIDAVAYEGAHPCLVDKAHAISPPNPASRALSGGTASGRGFGVTTGQGRRVAYLILNCVARELPR